MRLIRFLTALLCLFAGAALGALNPQPVSLDLGIATAHATLGVCVLASLLLGVAAGGIVLMASVVLPLRQQVRRAVAPASAVSPPLRAEEG